MIEPTRVLQPVYEQTGAIRTLTDYQSPAELAGAIATVWPAIDRSLRLLLRSDPGIPDSLRLSALSPAELPAERLIEVLRQRELISLELAGSIHELTRSTGRVESGDVRAADADLTRRVVDRLHTEVHEQGERPVREAAHQVVVEGELEEPAHPVPAAGRRRYGVWAGAGVLALAAVVMAALLLRGGGDEQLQRAVAAYESEQLAVAESGLRAVLRDEPRNVTALLYLGRIYRGQARYDDAAAMLRLAERAAPDDADVRAELGHLLLNLGRPQAAVVQYRRALDAEPEHTYAWVGLIRALRATGDPRAEELLREAPPPVRDAIPRGG